MEEPFPPAPDIDAAPRRRLPPIFWLLVGLVLALVLLGAGLIFYSIRLSRPAVSPSEQASPWDSLQSGEISVGLAVWSLAGIEPEQLYRQTMSGDDLETATATAVASPALPGDQRLGWLAVLARRQGAAGDRAEAGRLYQLAADLAMLKPGLGDSQRARALLAVAEGRADLVQPEAARPLLEQVTLIAQQSPELASPVRKQLLESVAAVYDRLGDDAAARATRALPADTPATGQPPPPDPLASLLNPPSYNAEVARFQAARLQQAQAFVDAWLARDGEVSRGQLQLLEGALIDEDLARAVYYEQRLNDPNLSLEGRAALLWDRIKWLIIKYRAASGLYGTDIVPAWGAEQPAIRQSLHDAFVEFTAVLLDTVDLSPAEEQAVARYQLYRNVMMWARLGFYPDADIVFLANALNDALAGWENAAGILPLAAIDSDNDVRFYLFDAAAR